MSYNTTSRHLFDIVKRSIDLKVFVEREAGVMFSRSGHDRWMGICPLHKDGNPSFSVTKSGEGVWFFKCFGCQEKGTIIDFCMNFFDLPNPWSAVVLATEKEGIKCDESMIIKALQEANIQIDVRKEMDLAHFVASDSCRQLTLACEGDVETLAWISKMFHKMNNLLSDEETKPSDFNSIRDEIGLRMSILKNNRKAG